MRRVFLLKGLAGSAQVRHSATCTFNPTSSTACQIQQHPNQKKNIQQTNKQSINPTNNQTPNTQPPTNQTKNQQTINKPRYQQPSNQQPTNQQTKAEPTNNQQTNQTIPAPSNPHKVVKHCLLVTLQHQWTNKHPTTNNQTAKQPTGQKQSPNHTDSSCTFKDTFKIACLPP